VALTRRKLLVVVALMFALVTAGLAVSGQAPHLGKSGPGATEEVFVALGPARATDSDGLTAPGQWGSK
jgi:hypothetical protein